MSLFWRGSWADVKKEMRGRYPRHVWPDAPATATPTRRIGQLRCRITMPAGIDVGHHPALINAAERCPVKESIHPDTEVVLEWVWG